MRKCEQLRIGFLVQLKVGKLDAGVEPLSVGNDPFLQRNLRPIEEQPDLAARLALFVLKRDDDDVVASIEGDDIRIIGQIDLLLEENPERGRVRADSGLPCSDRDPRWRDIYRSK